jgi:hypothetical protein
MGLLLLSIIQGPSWGWTSSWTLGVMGAGLGVLATFFAVERRKAQPMLDVGLFRNLRFTAASGSITIAFFTLTGFTFLVTQYFQFLKGYSPFGTGVRLLPVAISIAVAALLGTRLVVRIGNKAVVATGLALFGLGLLWIASNTAATSYLVIAAQMIVGGGGMGLISAPATEAILGVVPKEKAGIGSAVNDATRLFGSALGVAVIGSVAASAYGSRLVASIPAGLPTQAAVAAKGSVGGALIAAQRLHQAGFVGTAHLLNNAATEAFIHSFATGCSVAGIVAILGSFVAAIFLPSRPGRVATVPAPSVAVAEPTAA